ncbi:unnamed protein product, partial [Discosporangium mesarthrocarpum]
MPPVAHISECDLQGARWAYYQDTEGPWVGQDLTVSSSAQLAPQGWNGIRHPLEDNSGDLVKYPRNEKWAPAKNYTAYHKGKESAKAISSGGGMETRLVTETNGTSGGMQAAPFVHSLRSPQQQSFQQQPDRSVGMDNSLAGPQHAFGAGIGPPPGVAGVGSIAGGRGNGVGDGNGAGLVMMVARHPANAVQSHHRTPYGEDITTTASADQASLLLPSTLVLGTQGQVQDVGSVQNVGVQGLQGLGQGHAQQLPRQVRDQTTVERGMGGPWTGSEEVMNSALASIPHGASSLPAAAVPTVLEKFPGFVRCVMDIAPEVVGWVIGRSGAHIKEMKHRSGCGMWVDQKDLKLYITGADMPRIHAAARLVADLISKAPVNVNSAGVEDEVTSHMIECPPHLIGLLIGRGGSTIKRIKEESRANVVINQKMMKVIVSGIPQSVRLGVAMIEDVITFGRSAEHMGGAMGAV